MGIQSFLRALREARGLSLAEVAGSAGVPRPTVWRAETAPYMVKGQTLRRLLSGLRVREGSRDWCRAVALWTAARVGESNSVLMEKLLARVSQLTPEQMRSLKTWLDKRR